MNITVFTPTYNRGYTIETLYKSLQNQTYRQFEWLVIDDGSTDDTEMLIKKWMNESNFFEIRYYKVENGGKHRAINKATDLAIGRLFFIVDSDDWSTRDALQIVAKWEQTLDDGHKYCGIAGNKGTQNGLVGTTFEGEYKDATSLERNKNNITGDKAEVFYTSVLRNYKFVEVEGEKFMSEATVWNRMAYDGYQIRWFNETIYLCEYLEDGLTRNMKNTFSSNPIGTAYYFNQQIKFYGYNWKGRFANYNLYYDYVKDRVSLKQAATYLNIRPIILHIAVLMVTCKKWLSNGVQYES